MYDEREQEAWEAWETELTYWAMADHAMIDWMASQR